MKITHRTRIAAIAAATLLGILCLAAPPALAFSGWGVSAQFHLDTSTGACCMSAGTCTFTFQTGCQTPNIWQGATTTCSPSPCLAGACCQYVTCGIFSQPDCAARGGVYQGNGVLCAPSDLCLTSSAEGQASNLTLSVQAAPSPSTGDVRIVYEVPRPTMVALRVFDASGRLVRQLVNEPRVAGEHSLTWDGRDDAGQALPSGVYWTRMETAEGKAMGKVVLAK